MIVIGYDGSEDARRALGIAADLLSGRLLLVHVWDPLPPGTGPAVATPGIPGAGRAGVASAAHELEQAAREILDDGVGRARELGGEVEPLLVRGRGGGAWRELVDVAEERKARVIVVGRRGVSRLRGALLGSVSKGVVQHTHLPVLVVPPDGE